MIRDIITLELDLMTRLKLSYENLKIAKLRDEVNKTLAIIREATPPVQYQTWTSDNTDSVAP